MPLQKQSDTSTIVYEIFIQSFRDSNGDGIGDIKGLIEKLDYIQDLGANAVWVMPFHPSPSYHKYDVSDYYGVHADYGTMADLEELISELHQRDMKLIMDFVINHTSEKHPWFVGALSSATHPYHDYYVWRDYAAVQDEITKKTTTFDSDNILQWHAGPDPDQKYYGFFWKGMPDLNFDNPKVREEIYAIGKFWLGKGVDGFRLDAAKHIYPDDQLDDTRLFWEEFTATMQAVKKDVIIVGEVWADPPTLVTFFKGLPSLFNFELPFAISEAIQNHDVKKFTGTYSNMANAYAVATDSFEVATLISNHDMNRIRSRVGDDIQKSKLAASILLTLPGTPYLYYGEELGMLGVKPDEHLREPFLWGDDNFKNATWMQLVQSKPPAVHTLKDQMADPHSIYHHYKKWISLRQKYPVLANGELKFENSEDSSLLIYQISAPSGVMMAVHNFSDQQKNFPLPEKTKPVDGDTPNDRIMVIEPYVSVLLEVIN